jgi:SNF2 family DNA or RNA helicase
MTYEDFRSRHITEDNCPQFIVFDECHKLKSPTSAQAKQALKASEIMDDIYGNDGYLIMLSGTPAPKDPTDWWMLTEICRPGFLLEGDVSKLRYRLGNMAQNESGYWTVRKDETHPSGWKESEVTNLYRRMRGIVKVWFKKDCLDLPPKKYEVREIKPTRAMILVANAITEQAESTLAARIKLRQLSDGFQYRYVYDPDGVRMKRDGYDFVGSPKEDELKRDLEQYEDIGRIVIYAGFQASIERICAVVKGCGWSYAKYDGTGKEVYLNPDDEISAKVDSEMFSQGEVDFSAVLKQMDKSLNTGSIKKLAFIGQTDSAGAGLEFSASPVNIYYSNSDSGAGRMQSEDRGHSGNMDKSLGLTIIDYCHLKVDYVIRDSLLNKRDLQNISMGELYDSL